MRLLSALVVIGLLSGCTSIEPGATKKLAITVIQLSIKVLTNKKACARDPSKPGCTVTIAEFPF